MIAAPATRFAGYQTPSPESVRAVRTPYKRLRGTTPRTSGTATTNRSSAGTAKGWLVITQNSALGKFFGQALHRPVSVTGRSAPIGRGSRGHGHFRTTSRTTRRSAYPVSSLETAPVPGARNAWYRAASRTAEGK